MNMRTAILPYCQALCTVQYTYKSPAWVNFPISFSRGSSSQDSCGTSTYVHVYF